jgi:Domain of unknown function (DUF1707)
VPSRPGPRDLRASDTDRDRVVALLAEAAADGRLAADEHADRVSRAYSARTLGELAALTADLTAPGDQPIRVDHRRAVSAAFGRQVRAGHWVVPEGLLVTALLGEVVLDVRQAVLQSQRVTIYATLLGGRLELIVPDGVAVELTGPGTAGAPPRPGGARSRQAQPAPAGTAETTGPPGSPVIEVRTLVPGGRIRVTAPKPPRRRRVPGWPVSRRRRS